MANFGRIRGYSRVTKRGRNYVTATLGYWCKSSARTSLERMFYGSRLNGYSGDYRPLCTRVTTRLGALGADKDLMLPYYETPRVPGKSRIRTRTVRIPQTRRVDLDGKIIFGPDIGGYTVWRTVQGQPTTYVNVLRIILETAYPVSDFNMATIWQIVGRVNHAPVPVFGNAPKGSVLLAGYDTNYKLTEDLIYIDYLFDLWPDGWNNFVQSQPYTIMVHKIPTILLTDRPDKPTGPTRDVQIELPAKRVLVNSQGTPTLDSSGNLQFVDAPVEPRRIFKEANFGSLSAMVEW